MPLSEHSEQESRRMGSVSGFSGRDVSVMSGGSRRALSVISGDAEVEPVELLNDTFVFKVKYNNTFFRIAAEAGNYEALHEIVCEKVGHAAFQLRYVDDEMDFVVIETDEDLVGAVAVAKSAGWKRLVLEIVGGDEHWIPRTAGEVAACGIVVVACVIVIAQLVRLGVVKGK